MKLVDKVYTIRPLFDNPSNKDFVLEILGRTHIGSHAYIMRRLKLYKDDSYHLIYGKIGSDEQYKIRLVSG